MAIHFNTIDWAKNAIIYEVNIRQYTTEGTFAAFAKHLPRLTKMGIDVIWLMPITPISLEKRQGTLGSYYACSSYTKINREFGDLTDFKNLVTQAHNLGLKVIIDWVANHTGCDHEWTKTNKDFYILDTENNFTERNGWKDVIDLNYNNELLHKAMIDAMEYWIIECKIDGFRCDMAHLVTLDFWQKARTECDAIKPLYWLAECDEPEYLKVFDTSYAWQWMHETEKVVKQESSVHHMYNILHNYTNFTQLSSKLFFTSNHDENSWNGTEQEKYGKLAKAFAVFTFTWQGTPLVYSGQEIPNSKRLQFFEKDNLDWNKGLLLEKFYTTLSYLHKTTAISFGETIILPSENNVMCYLRKNKDEVVLVILNLSNQDRLKFTVENEFLKGYFKNIFTGFETNFTSSNTFELMGGDYLVYKNF